MDRQMAGHVAGGGAVLLTSHHPLELSAGRLRRIALGGGAPP